MPRSLWRSTLMAWALLNAAQLSLAQTASCDATDPASCTGAAASEEDEMDVQFLQLEHAEELKTATGADAGKPELEHAEESKTATGADAGEPGVEHAEESKKATTGADAGDPHWCSRLWCSQCRGHAWRVRQRCPSRCCSGCGACR